MASESGATSARRIGPNDKIVLGVIGLSGRGLGTHIPWFSAHPDVEIGALCDVYN